MNKTILLVEDDASIRELLQITLQQAGFTFLTAANATAAEKILAHQLPDLILLDWMLPVTNGIEFAQKIKADARINDIPIIMLTALETENSKVKALEAGADDYIVKPFSPRELIARIKAVLRRTSPNSENLKVGNLHLQLSTQQITIDHQKLKLGPKEYQLLHFFMSHPERVYTRNQLLDRVWGLNAEIDERSVDVCIRRLRHALTKKYRVLIETVHGSGYRFSEKNLKE